VQKEHVWMGAPFLPLPPYPDLILIKSNPYLIVDFGSNGKLQTPSQRGKWDGNRFA